MEHLEDFRKPAQTEARLLGNDYIGTEHLLLAISAQIGTVASWALSATGVDYDNLRLAIVTIIQQLPLPSSGDLPWTPRARMAIQNAFEEAHMLHHEYVGLEHLLLGLMRVPQGVAVEALQRLRADFRSLRRDVLEGLGQE